MSEYNLDTEAAKQADSGSGRITETGQYTGKFTVAKKVLSKKGTQGIEFSFLADSGQSADYLSMWTVNHAGEHIYGFKQLMALMTCLKVRGIDSSTGTVEEYDRDSQSMVKKQAEVYTALMNKPIGVLLQMEEYEKKDGTVGTKAAFAGFFDAETQQVATEILEKSDAKILDKLYEQLVPIKKLKGSRSSSTQSAPAGMPASAWEDDEIPF